MSQCMYTNQFQLFCSNMIPASNQTLKEIAGVFFCFLGLADRMWCSEFKGHVRATEVIAKLYATMSGLKGVETNRWYMA